MKEIRRIPVHRSLHRRILVLGAEYDLVFLCGFITILMILGGMTKISFVSGLLFWFISLYCLQKIAKVDPYMSKIFSKYIKQQDYYPAHRSVL